MEKRLDVKVWFSQVEDREEAILTTWSKEVWVIAPQPPGLDFCPSSNMYLVIFSLTNHEVFYSYRKSKELGVR